MTFVAGWKNRRSVFIAGDAAITDSGAATGRINERTSFSEPTIDGAVGLQALLRGPSGEPDAGAVDNDDAMGDGDRSR